MDMDEVKGLFDKPVNDLTLKDLLVVGAGYIVVRSVGRLIMHPVLDRVGIPRQSVGDRARAARRDERLMPPPPQEEAHITNVINMPPGKDE